MPLQNRVDPWGCLHAVEARGTLLGNRGILHNASKEIVAASAHKDWVTCRLTHKGRKREVFSLGSYSELFFLDGVPTREIQRVQVRLGEPMPVSCSGRIRPSQKSTKSSMPNVRCAMLARSPLRHRLLIFRPARSSY